MCFINSNREKGRDDWIVQVSLLSLIIKILKNDQDKKWRDNKNQDIKINIIFFQPQSFKIEG